MALLALLLKLASWGTFVVLVVAVLQAFNGGPWGAVFIWFFIYCLLGFASQQALRKAREQEARWQHEGRL